MRRVAPVEEEGPGPMADLDGRRMSERAAVVRELACSLELRIANGMLAAAAIAAVVVPPGPAALQARVWAPLGLASVALPALVHYLGRHRVVLVMAGYPEAYSRVEALCRVRSLRRTYEDGLCVSDFWWGRVLLGWAATALGVAAVVLIGQLPGMGHTSPELPPAAVLPGPALSGWVSVAMWRRYLRHQVARVTHVDSSGLMMQDGYRWTWWWGWR